jgi:hypothetical protein
MQSVDVLDQHLAEIIHILSTGGEVLPLQFGLYHCYGDFESEVHCDLVPLPCRNSQELNIVFQQRPC